MSPQLEAIINEVQKLNPLEQIELISTISQSLQEIYNTLPLDNTFWQPKTLEQIYKENKIKVVTNIDDYAADFWPEDESVEEFNYYIHKQRQDDRLNYY